MPKTIARGAAFAALLVLVAACGSVEETVREEPAGPLGASDRAHLIAAYHPWWTQNAWRGYAPTLYDEVYFFAVEIDSTGGIAARNGWPDRWYVMQQSLGNAGVRVTPVVTLFNQERLSDFFGHHRPQTRCWNRFWVSSGTVRRQGGCKSTSKFFSPSQALCARTSRRS